MAWPNHTPQGQLESAQSMIATIIATATARLALGVDVDKYEQILGHAYLDKWNHAHGRLRTLVRPDGSGVSGDTSLDTAWNDVQRARNGIVGPPPLTAPTIQAILLGIDHGGTG